MRIPLEPRPAGPADKKHRYFVHSSALCESAQLGTGTRIWAFAHVMAGAIVGKDCNIGDHAFIESGATLGNRVTVKNHVLLWDGISVADDVFLGPAVVFTNDRHPRSPRMEGVAEVARRYSKKDRWLLPTRVKKGASIGAGSIILPGLVIGAYAMVGAGTLVTQDVPDHGLVLGAPGRLAGWVCRCGRKLTAQEGNRHRCRRCGSAYRASGRGLIGASPHV